MIKECTPGHHSLEDLHKYKRLEQDIVQGYMLDRLRNVQDTTHLLFKRTSSQQQFDVSMALVNNENVLEKPKSVLHDFDDDNSDDDFQLLKKKI